MGIPGFRGIRNTGKCRALDMVIRALCLLLRPTVTAGSMDSDASPDSAGIRPGNRRLQRRLLRVGLGKGMGARLRPVDDSDGMAHFQSHC